MPLTKVRDARRIILRMPNLFLQHAPSSSYDVRAAQHIISISSNAFRDASYDIRGAQYTTSTPCKYPFEMCGHFLLSKVKILVFWHPNLDEIDAVFLRPQRRIRKTYPCLNRHR